MVSEESRDVLEYFLQTTLGTQELLGTRSL